MIGMIILSAIIVLLIVIVFIPMVIGIVESDVFWDLCDWWKDRFSNMFKGNKR